MNTKYEHFMLYDIFFEKQIAREVNEIIVNKPNPLLWCLYLFLHTEMEFRINSEQYEYITIQDLRYSMIDFLYQSKEMLKLYKLSKSILETNLLSETLELTTFLALCQCITSMNVIYLCDSPRIYYKIHNKVDSDLFHVIRPGFGISYACQLDVPRVSIPMDSYYLVDIKLPIHNPLRSIHQYKVDELREMCMFFDIPLKTKKLDLFDSLSVYLCKEKIDVKPKIIY